MKSRLFICLEKKDHPYVDEPGANYEAWGEIKIFILTEQEEICLFQTQWDLALFAEWFVENYEAIQSEYLIIGGEKVLPSENLSHALARFSDREFADIDSDEAIDWSTSIDEYLDRHLLNKGLPGSKTPMIIIGCNHQVGEISLYWDGTDWVYQFDMDDFMEDTKREIKAFLEQWCQNGNDRCVRERAKNILAALK